MKTKKLFLPIIILVAAIVVTTVYSVVSSVAQKPSITEAEFPFSVTYEVDGEKVTIQDVYKVRYIGNDGYADTKSRIYEGETVATGEDTTVYTIKKDDNTRVELWTQFYPDYLMGDSEYDYFDDEAFEPKLYYYDSEEIECYDEETLAKQGVKLISFEYPTPIENSLVFSHISYFSSAVVLPSLLIALLALGAILIFVKKENELKYNAVDSVSIVFNFVIGFIFVPFVSILALLIDMEGGGPEFYHQAMYFIPVFSVLCIELSIALRRKGYRVKSLITQFAGPVVFATYLIACAAMNLI